MPAKHADTQPLPAPVRHAIAKTSIEVGATPKQLEFAMNRAAGLPQTQSYLKAYDTNPDRSYESVARDAHFVARNPKVHQMLEAARISQSNLTASRGQQWREKIDEKLWDIVESKEVAEKDRIAALKLAGSQVHVQAFSKAVDASDAAIANLKDAVSSFFSAASSTGVTIDADFSPVIKSLETWQPVDSIESVPLDDPYDELDTHGNQAFKRLADDDEVLQL